MRQLIVAFALIIVSLVSGTEQIGKLICRNSQNRPLSHRVYCLDRCDSSGKSVVGRVKGAQNFSHHCPPNNGFSSQQVNLEIY